MNRATKFRAYQAHTSLHRKPGMYVVTGLELYSEHGGGEAFLAEPNQHALSSEYLEDIWLMQYTGLKDKNGVEIYEGDILAAKFQGMFIDRVYWKGPPDAICTVNFDYAGFRLTATGEDDQRYVDFWDFTDQYSAGNLCMMQNSETKVIGNVYENPELLEPGKAGDAL